MTQFYIIRENTKTLAFSKKSPGLSMSDGFVFNKRKCKIRNVNIVESTDERMYMWSYYQALSYVFGYQPTQL